MNGLHDRIVSAALVLVVGLMNGAAAQAQTTAAHAVISGPSTAAGTSAVSSLSTGSGVSTMSSSAAASSSAYGMGMPLMPLAMPFFAPSGSNPAADLTGLPSANTAPSNLFANPYAAPLLYSSMLPGLGNQLSAQGQTASTAGVMGGAMSPMSLGATQMGLMMLATQRPTGTGPGGDRRPARGQATTARQANGRVRTAPPPGGLAARYFNRTGPRSPYPQSYYNRQNRYFP